MRSLKALQMNILTNLFLGYGKICKNFFSKSFIIFLQCVKQDHVWPDFHNPLFTVHFSSSNQRRLILLCVMENSWAGLGVGIVLSGLCVYNHITGKCVIIRICIPSTFLQCASQTWFAISILSSSIHFLIVDEQHLLKLAF